MLPVKLWHSNLASIAHQVSCKAVAYEAMAFKLGMTEDLCMAYYGHARFDDLDLDARSHWLGRGQNSALNDLDN